MGLAQTEDDAEGQTYRWGLKPANEPANEEDAEGQGIRWNGLAQTDEDAEGQGYRLGGFAPVEGEDTEANALQSHVLDIEKDENGELVGRFVPADDTGGQGYRING